MDSRAFDNYNGMCIIDKKCLTIQFDMYEDSHEKQQNFFSPEILNGLR